MIIRNVHLSKDWLLVLYINLSEMKCRFGVDRVKP